MCFSIIYNDIVAANTGQARSLIIKRTIKIAEKDFTVYKLLEKIGSSKKKYKAPYRYFTWEKGWHYYQDDDKLKPSTHVWKRYLFGNDAYSGYVDIDEGLYAYTNERAAKQVIRNLRNQVVVKLVVPKGAKYAIDNNGVIIATEMIFY